MIKTCASLCRESYVSNSLGFMTVGDLRFGVRVIDGVKYIIIRGTANAKNWLRDAQVFPVRSCGGYLAHRGFVNAYRALCSGGLPTEHNTDVVATGHSLGGAIATLLAEHIGCKLVTFGSPRVYWRFGSAPRLDHARVICDDDPVPMIPRLLYSHRCEPTVLCDQDHQIINIADHDIDVYMGRLQIST
jgi:hypothetical protein